MARLIIIKGEKAGSEAELGDSDFRIGRDPSGNMVLADTSVSRNHALIRPKAGKYELVDSSSNGTKINGKAAKKKVLEDSDEIEIGGTTLKFEAGRDETMVSSRPAAGETVAGKTGKTRNSGAWLAAAAIMIVAIAGISYFSKKAPDALSVSGKNRALSGRTALPAPGTDSGNPEYYFRMGNRLYREKGVRDENLHAAILMWKKGYELSAKTGSDTESRITGNIARFEKELESETRDEMFRAYQAFHLDDTLGCRLHLERITRLVPDADDPYYRLARSKLSALGK